MNRGGDLECSTVCSGEQLALYETAHRVVVVVCLSLTNTREATAEVYAVAECSARVSTTSEEWLQYLGAHVTVNDL